MVHLSVTPTASCTALPRRAAVCLWEAPGSRRAPGAPLSPGWPRCDNTGPLSQTENEMKCHQRSKRTRCLVSWLEQKELDVLMTRPGCLCKAGRSSLFKSDIVSLWAAATFAQVRGSQCWCSISWLTLHTFYFTFTSDVIFSAWCPQYGVVEWCQSSLKTADK